MDDYLRWLYTSAGIPIKLVEQLEKEKAMKITIKDTKKNDRLMFRDYPVGTLFTWKDEYNKDKISDPYMIVASKAPGNLQRSGIEVSNPYLPNVAAVNLKNGELAHFSSDWEKFILLDGELTLSIKTR